MREPVGTISCLRVAKYLGITELLAVQFLTEARERVPDCPLDLQIDSDQLARRALVTLPTGDILELIRNPGFVVINAHDTSGSPGVLYFSLLPVNYISDTVAAQEYVDQFTDTQLLYTGQLKPSLHDNMAPLYRKVERLRQRSVFNKVTLGLLGR